MSIIRRAYQNYRILHAGLGSRLFEGHEGAEKSSD
jgi:hypothetical protein